MGALTNALNLTLEHVADGYAAAGITAPGRSYVSPGAPPADCELVAVWGAPQVKERGANANPSVQNCSIIPQANITITSWLCVPTGTPPPEADLQTAGERIADHLWAVWSHLASLISSGTFLDDLPCAGGQLLNGFQVLDEEGAFAGWQIGLLLDLNPFRTDPAS